MSFVYMLAKHDLQQTNKQKGQFLQQKVRLSQVNSSVVQSEFQYFVLNVFVCVFKKKSLCVLLLLVLLLLLLGFY